MLMVSSLCAGAFEVGGLKYTILSSSPDATGLIPVRCDGYASSSTASQLYIDGFTIYNGTKYHVKEIEWESFENNKSLVTVQILTGVEKIGGYCFYGCSNLKNLYLPNSLNSIGNYAFYGLHKSLIISGAWLGHVPALGTAAFDYSNTNIFFNVPTRDTETLCKQTSLKSFKFQIAPQYANDVRFARNGLCYCVTKLPTTTSVGEMALVGTNVETDDVVIDEYSETYSTFSPWPNRIEVTSIAPKAFYNNVNINSGVTKVDLSYYNGRYNNNKREYITIGDSAFFGCTKLTTAKLLDAHVGNGAFQNCTSLSTLNLYYGSIGNYAFSGCSSLSGSSGTLSLGGYGTTDKLTISGDYAFEKTSVMKVYIYNSVDYINPLAFTNCLSLQEYEVSSDNLKYSSYNTMLFDKGQTKLVSVPTYSKNVSIDHNVLPNSVTAIGDYALYGNKRVWYMYVPYGITRIGSYAFQNSSLISLNIPSSVIYFGLQPIFGCSSLKYIGLNKEYGALPSKDVFYIGSNKYFSGTFYYPVKTHYTLSEMDKDDSDYEKYKYYVDGKKEYGAFDLLIYTDSYTPFCFNLDKSKYEATVVPGKSNGNFLRPTGTTINIPASVSTRGENYTVTRLGNAAFINNTTVTTINVPNSVRVFDGYFPYKWYSGSDGYNSSMYSSYGDPDKPRDGFQFYGCTNLTNVKLPSALECVPYSCFRKTKVKNVILPYGVQIIAGSAFEESAVETLLVPSSVKRFSGNELKNATNLKTLFLNVPYDKLGDADGKGSYEYKYYTLFDTSMPSNMNVYIPASEAVFVSDGNEPLSANDKWKNDNLYSRHKLHIGAFDFYANNGTNQVYLTVTDAEKRKCKYVFVPSTLSAAIKSVNIGGKVTDYNYDVDYYAETMDPYAFLNCINLSEVKLSISLYNIPNFAFKGTTSLKTFPFQNPQCQSLKTIGGFAFEGSGLSGSVVLPGENLTSIGSYAFSSCKSINKLYVRYHPKFTVNTDYPIFSDMGNNFICYVDHRRFPYYYQKYTGFDTSSANYSSQLQPFLNPSHKWTTASFPKLFDSKGKVATNYTVSLANLYKQGGKVYALGATPSSQSDMIIKTKITASGKCGVDNTQGYLIEATPGAIIDLSTTNTRDLKVADNKLYPSALALEETGGQISLTKLDNQYCQRYGIYALEPSNGNEPFLTRQSKYDGEVGDAYAVIYPFDSNTVKIVDQSEGGHLKGDVNEDKKVDISDIVAVINQIAGTATYRYADVNEDKKVDISDIVAIINIIAGQ